MISCLPSLCLAGFAFLKAFGGGFSAVALMEARDRRAGARQSPGRALCASSPGTSVPALSWALLGRAAFGDKSMGSRVAVVSVEGQLPKMLAQGADACREPSICSRHGLGDGSTWSCSARAPLCLRAPSSLRIFGRIVRRAPSPCAHMLLPWHYPRKCLTEHCPLPFFPGFLTTLGVKMFALNVSRDVFLHLPALLIC